MTDRASFYFSKMEPPRDGTSNTLMIGEVVIQDGEHVLTAIRHTAIDTSVPAEPVTFTFTVSVDNPAPDDGFMLI